MEIKNEKRLKKKNKKRIKKIIKIKNIHLK